MSRPLRLLTLGHSYVVAMNRRLANEMAIAGDGRWAVTAIAPSQYPGDLRDIDLEPITGERVRTVSMNAMLGNAGEFMMDGVNTNNPTYRQFMRLGEVPEPSRIFAFIEEHPDSINDGYFLNRFYSDRWIDLPASFNNGGAALAYADGHAELHYWRFGHTKPPPRPDAAGLPLIIPSGQRGDYYWVMSQTSVHADEPAVASSY